MGKIIYLVFLIVGMTISINLICCGNSALELLGLFLFMVTSIESYNKWPFDERKNNKGDTKNKKQ